MEINITKQNINTNEAVFEQVIEQPIDSDFTMPDYYPDIVRILKCRITPNIYSKNISGETLTIEGGAIVTVIYTDQSNKICSFESNVDFHKSVEIGDGDVSEKRLVSVIANTEYVNCRPTTPRKIDLHSVLSLKIKIICPNRKDIITDIDCEGMQLQTGSCMATNPLDFSEKIVVIEEDLELSRGSGIINSVLRSNINTIVEQCKLIGNKAVVKGDISVDVLYCTNEGLVERCENRIPFNQIIDMNVEGEDCKCDAELKVLSASVKPRNNLSGEAKSFTFECKLSIVAMASCENDIPVVYDAFCTKYDMANEYENIIFKKLDSSLNERYMCKKTLDFSEKTFGSIIDMWCENKIGQVKISNGLLSLNGTSVICMLTYDCDNQLQYYERSVDFEYSNKVESEYNNLDVDADVITASCAYTVMGEDKVEVRIELCILAQIYALNVETVMVEAKVNNELTTRMKKAPIIVYYAHEGENVWDIAKNYNANCSDIMAINQLEDYKILNNSVLLIP